MNNYDELAKLRADNERLRAALAELVERYAARTNTGSVVSGSEQYPWIARAMCELTERKDTP